MRYAFATNPTPGINHPPASLAEAALVNRLQLRRGGIERWKLNWRCGEILCAFDLRDQSIG